VSFDTWCYVASHEDHSNEHYAKHVIEHGPHYSSYE
jgi:hypothetical protein